MKNFLKRIYEIIEVAQDDDKYSKLYDSFFIFIILISIIPLAIKIDELSTNLILLFNVLDYVCVGIFILDFVLRLITAPLKYKKGGKSIFLYLISPFAIIDILSILPSLRILDPSFKLLKMFRLCRCLRVFKALRFSKNFILLSNVFSKQKETLLSILSMALIYIFLTALIMFNVEPETFNNFFDALYWAVTALTTVGYGDIYPLSDLGRLVSMFSSLFGVAMIALPSGVLTAGFMEEFNKDNEE